QVRALSRLATGIAQSGDPDRAESLIRTITDRRDPACALTALAAAIAPATNPQPAYRHDTVRATPAPTDPHPQGQPLTRLATAIAQSGDPDRAFWLAVETEILNPPDRWDQAEALIQLAAAIAQAGDLDHAVRVTSAIRDDHSQDMAAIELITAIA